MTTLTTCQTCRLYPGVRGAFCPAGHFHATAHPRVCKHYRPDENAAHIATLRRLATDWLHIGDYARYVQTLNLAHKLREAMR